MKNNSGAFAAGIVLVLLGLWVASLLNLTIPVKIQTSGSPQELAVVGTGQVDVVPDTVRITFGIRVEQKNSVEAVQKEMNEKSKTVTEALLRSGVKKENIKTSNYSINPEYDYNSPQRRLLGYSGNMTIDVKVQPTTLAPQVIADATAAGANEVQNTQFIVESPEKYRAEARQKAIENARQQAEAIAKDLGIGLGKAVNLVEASGGSPVYPVAMYADKVGAGGGGPTMESGTQTINSTVTVYFEKK